jgi:hypothetical protein
VDEVNVALDRLLIRDALAKLSPQHRAVMVRSYSRSGRPRRSPTIAEFPKVP